MGRLELSQGLAPPAVRKDIRAKQARNIINKVIPALLASNVRARKGTETSELIADPASHHAPVATGNSDVPNAGDAAYVKRKGQGRRKVKAEGGSGADSIVFDNKSRTSRQRRQDSLDQDLANLSIFSTNPSPQKPERRTRIITTDTLTAAHMLTHPSQHAPTPPKPAKKTQNVCILNMASPLRPGGGVLTGATSQEEFLCARTTLLPSLKESFYRLPELGGIWSPDVLVFRSRLALGDAVGDLGPGERYWVDVISAGMLRFPELEGAEDETKRLGRADRALVEKKMRAVLRIAAARGVKKLVLGAWGCGAYGNPVGDVARGWRGVLDPGVGSSGGKKGKVAETWPDLEEVVFAISNRNMAAEFARAFGGGIEVEAGPGEVVEHDEVAEELRAKIQEMQGQLGQVWNPDLKSRMGVILEGLKAQLKEREGGSDEQEENSERDGESSAQPDISDADVGDDNEEESEEDDDEYEPGQPARQ
tara:strand:- start:12917 stop:14353 length:1437 start_codon:yes stop_codon:yes gene_type:complete